jgi:hypothetical protein
VSTNVNKQVLDEVSSVEMESSNSKIKIRHILAAAFCLHVAVTTSIYLAGAAGVLPHLFDVNGAIVTSDSVVYRADAIAFTSIFTEKGAAAWFKEPAQFHVKVYSVCFLLFSRWFDFTVLAAEPVNVLCYLLILYLVFCIGREVFGLRVAFLSASVTALWPSLMMHTTQWLKDQLFITAILVLILIAVKWLNRTYSLRGGIATGALGGIAGIILWHIKSDTWELVVAIVFLITMLLAVRMFNERKLFIGNSVGAALLLATIQFAPWWIPSAYSVNSRTSNAVYTSEQETTPAGNNQPQLVSTAKERVDERLRNISASITLLRQRFIKYYPDAGSNIDSEIIFHNTADVIYYLPRAMTIGFFAPFPNMWFIAGRQTGRAGRLLGGLETSAMYVFELMVPVGLWCRRKRLDAWLLFLASALGVMALGLVVTNAGALYRMRYVFWILLIIVGSAGLNRIFSTFHSWRKARHASSA